MENAEYDVKIKLPRRADRLEARRKATAYQQRVRRKRRERRLASPADYDLTLGERLTLLWRRLTR